MTGLELNKHLASGSPRLRAPPGGAPQWDLGDPQNQKYPTGASPWLLKGLRWSPRKKWIFNIFFFRQISPPLHARWPSEKNEVERNFFAPKPPKLDVLVKSGQGSRAVAPVGLRDAGGLRQPPPAPPPPSPSPSPAVPSGSAGAHLARLGLA